MFITAKVKNIQTVLLTGSKHGSCREFADLVVAVAESETYKIQELHLPLYHTLCLAVESQFFKMMGH
jgi:D-sedoheptulose 7-phosphate isomerase